MLYCTAGTAGESCRVTSGASDGRVTGCTWPHVCSSSAQNPPGGLLGNLDTMVGVPGVRTCAFLAQRWPCAAHTVRDTQSTVRVCH